MKEQFHILPNGTWTGMLGKLADKEIDLYMGADIMDEDRCRSFQVFESYSISSVRVIGSVESKRQDNFFRFLLTVDNSIWLWLSACFCCLVLVSAIVDMFHYRGHVTLHDGISQHFWTYLAAFFSEGTPRSPVSRQNQCLLMTWLYCILVLSCAVAGQFRAAITISEDDDNVRTLLDVANRPHLMPYVVKKSHFETTLSMSTFPHYQKLYKRIQDNPKKGFLTMPQFISASTLQRVKDGKGVLFTNQNVYKIMVSMFCDQLKGPRRFYVLDELIATTYHPMFANPDLPPYLYHKFNQRFLILRESGLGERLRSGTYARNFVQCMSRFEDSSDEIRLLFKHLSSVFLLLLTCHAFSFLVFIGEIIVFKLCGYFRENNNRCGANE